MPEDNDSLDASKNGASLEELDRGDLVTIIKNLRQENAAKRVKDRDLEQKLSEYEAWKTSQMSELEKIQAERDSAVQSAKAALVEVFASKYNVPEERVKFISGVTREEIEEAAKVLGNPKTEDDANSGTEGEKNEKKTEMPDLFPGVRGKPVASDSSGTDFDSILRDQLRRSR